MTGILALGAAATAYYNWRVTGDPLLLPYRLKFFQYSVYPNFIFEKPRLEPHYNHEVIRDFYVRTEGSFQIVPESVSGFRQVSSLQGKGVVLVFPGSRAAASSAPMRPEGADER